MIEAIEAVPYLGGIILVLLGGALLDQIADRTRSRR